MRLQALTLLGAGGIALGGIATGASTGGVPDHSRGVAAFEAITPALRHLRCFVCHSQRRLSASGQRSPPAHYGHAARSARRRRGTGALQHLPSGSRPCGHAYASRRAGLAPAVAAKSTDQGRTDGQPVVPASDQSKAQRRTGCEGHRSARAYASGFVPAKGARQRRSPKPPS